MPYIGTSPSNSVRRVHTYTATASQTTFSGASSEGVTLSYADTNYLDVYQNGILLGSADYTATSGTSVVLAQAASASDLVVIVVYEVFSVADTVSKANGGTFDSAVTVDGAFTSTGIDDNASSTAITLDSVGSLLVGTTNNRPAEFSHPDGFSVRGDTVGQIQNTVTNATNALFNRDGTDGTIIELRKEGSAVGSIGVTGTDILYVANPDGSAVGFNFDGDNPKINPCDGTGSGTDGVADLGHSGGRYKDLYLSGGAYIGGTGSANYLDDYEEGTWTPAVNSGGVTFGTLHRAIYVKVGKSVFVQAFVGISSSGTANQFIIDGLPFSTLTNGYSTGSVDFGNGGVKGQYGRTGSSSDQVAFFYPSENVSNSRVNLNGNLINAYVIFSLTYETT